MEDQAVDGSLAMDSPDIEDGVGPQRTKPASEQLVATPVFKKRPWVLRSIVKGTHTADCKNVTKKFRSRHPCRHPPFSNTIVISNFSNTAVAHTGALQGYCQHVFLPSALCTNLSSEV